MTAACVGDRPDARPNASSSANFLSQANGLLMSGQLASAPPAIQGKCSQPLIVLAFKLFDVECWMFDVRCSPVFLALTPCRVVLFKFPGHTPVPEPGTGALLLCGVGLLFCAPASCFFFYK